MTSSTWAIIIASGKDEMMNEETCTAFLNLHNKPVLSYSLTAFEHCPEVDAVIVVAPRDRLEQVVGVIQLFGCHKVRKVVPGAPLEFASLVNGLKYVDDDMGILLVHEASRPGISASQVTELIKTAKRQGLAMLGHALTEPLAMVAKTGGLEKMIEPGAAWMYGAPLAVKNELLEKVMANLRKKKKTVKNIFEAMIFSGQKPRLVPAKQWPTRINTIDHLRSMEQSALE